MRDAYSVCGCFPTGQHYPAIADKLAEVFSQIQGLCADFDPSLSWKEAKLVVIDFETTGLSPQQDRVLEAGVACFDQGRLSASENWLINPGVEVPEEARAVHNISDQELADAPSFGPVFPELCEMLRDRLPVAYNADFDRGFLHSELQRLGGEAALPEKLPPALQPEVTWIDPLVWVRELQRHDKGKKLTDVCARLGIPLERAHRAAGDAEAAGRVLAALAPQMPSTYGELIRLQTRYAARQELERAGWRRR